MRKISILFIISSIFILPLFFTSCEKEDNQAEVIVWQNLTTANAWQIVNVSSLTCYVNGEIVASQASSIYFDSEPDCNSTGGMKFKINLQKNTTGKINIIIKDQKNDEWYNTQLDISSKKCNKLELTL